MRVIQRNLACIVGLPLDLADEELLRGSEYFGRYGKVVKVSISRTADGVLRLYPPNNTCNVYITYSKEEETTCCIQHLNGLVLDERTRLRASFGTTKYCHAWLRQKPCNNPNCSYLHKLEAKAQTLNVRPVV